MVLLHDLGEDLSQAARAAERVAEKLLVAILEARDLASASPPTTGSVGITLFRGREASVDAAMQQADIALQQAKAAGVNALRFFSSEMQAVARVHLEADLHQALRHEELALHYQVQVDEAARVTRGKPCSAGITHGAAWFRPACSFPWPRRAA